MKEDHLGEYVGLLSAFTKQHIQRTLDQRETRQTDEAGDTEAAAHLPPLRPASRLPGAVKSRI